MCCPELHAWGRRGVTKETVVRKRGFWERERAGFSARGSIGTSQLRGCIGSGHGGLSGDSTRQLCNEPGLRGSRPGPQKWLGKSGEFALRNRSVCYICS